MKSKGYIKKYDLNSGKGFDHSEFVFDLTNDFYSQLKWYKSSGEYREKKFWQVVSEIESKYNSIFYKCLTPQPEKLWGYFRATILRPAFFESFPQYEEIIDANIDANIEDSAGYVMNNSGVTLKCFTGWNNKPNSDDIRTDIERCYNSLNGYEHPFHIETIIRTHIKKLKSKLGRKVKEEKNERNEWKRKEQKRKDFFGNIFGNDFDPFFFSMFGGIFERMYNARQRLMKPSESFRILGIPEDATEDDVKKAYRKMVKTCHPDLHPGNQQAEEIFKQVNEANNKCVVYFKLEKAHENI